MRKKNIQRVLPILIHLCEACSMLKLHVNCVILHQKLGNISLLNAQPMLLKEKPILRNNPVLSDEIKSDLRNPEQLTQLTLDASFYVNTKDIDVLGLYSREFIVQIHRKRIARLNQISRC